MAVLTPEAVVMQDLFTRMTLAETTISVHNNEQIRASGITSGIQADNKLVIRHRWTEGTSKKTMKMRRPMRR